MGNCFRKSEAGNKKSRKSDVIERALKDVLRKRDFCAIDRVPNEILAMFFKLLPPVDRFRMEKVCKRWKNLLRKGYGWEMYSAVSCNDFPGCIGWTNTNERFRKIFEHSRFIRELCTRSFNVDETVCALLLMLPNLRHLNLNEVRLESARLNLVAELFPNLLSIGFSVFGQESFEGVTAILTQCNRLEILKIYLSEEEFSEYSFPNLPATLKCVYLGEEIRCSLFISQLAVLNVFLISLEIADPWINEIDFHVLSLNVGSRLKYLKVDVRSGTVESFCTLLQSLSNLQALNLSIRVFSALDPGPWTDQLWNGIADCCSGLKHFGLIEMTGTPINGDAFARLAGLTDLVSVHVRAFDQLGNHPVDNDLAVVTLFEKLSSIGKLENFLTTAPVKTIVMCHALINCRNLTSLFFQRAQSNTFNAFAKVLNAIHRNDQLPETFLDGRILHTNVGVISGLAILPQHPWALFHQRAPSNKLGEQICYGDCTNKPRYAEFQ